MAKRDKRYYWLKLQRDFFKRHDIRIIEEMPNGKDYILFYLKLLCESLDHNGNLRFSETIPYNAQMLSTITNTNIDIVKAAIDLFTQLGMMELYDDGTLYMSQVEKMTGSETYWAQKKREQRELESQKMLPTTTSCGEEDEDWTLSNAGPTCPSKSKSKSKSKSIDTYTDDSGESPKKAVRHKYGEYKHVRLTDKEHDDLIEDYGADVTAEAIRIVDEYCESSGKRYKNYNLVIHNWGADRAKENLRRTSHGKRNNSDSSINHGGGYTDMYTGRGDW